MEAKDTVMSESQIKQAVANADDKEGMSLAARFYLGTLSVAKAQAETTGKIMKQEGIREVVEWEDNHFPVALAGLIKQNFPSLVTEWLAQLKKWGI